MLTSLLQCKWKFITGTWMFIKTFIFELYDFEADLMT